MAVKELCRSSGFSWYHGCGQIAEREAYMFPGRGRPRFSGSVQLFFAGAVLGALIGCSSSGTNVFPDGTNGDGGGDGNPQGDRADPNGDRNGGDRPDGNTGQDSGGRDRPVGQDGGPPSDTGGSDMNGGSCDGPT